MAIVRRLEPIKLDRDSKHTEVDCTYWKEKPIHSFQPRSHKTIKKDS